MPIDATTTYRKDIKYPAPNASGFYRGYGWLIPRHSPQRDKQDIRAILVHTTNNPQGNTLYPSEARFLRDSPDVSIHYVVSSHDDTIVQVLPDTFVAWHSGDCADNDYQNPTSIGIEIAWAEGQGHLPQQAVDNLTFLVRELLRRYPWIKKIDTHRNQAVPRGRKSDPAGMDDATFARWRDSITAPAAAIPGVPGQPAVRVEKDFSDFWHTAGGNKPWGDDGGMYLFGYCLGVAGAYVLCERAVLKRESDGRVRPALRNETRGL
jgi:hypothetical protein